MISFNRFNGTKEDFELYKSSLGLSEEDIVFISDNNTHKFIYANGTYFGSTEIYEGTSEPEDLSVKLWLDTNEPTSLKYKNSDEEWEIIALGGEGSSSPEIYIGSEQPSDDSDVVVWYDTNGVDEPDEPAITTVTWGDIVNKPPFADVAHSGEFDDLKNVPDFTLTYIGEGEPEINSDFNRWINPNEDSFDGVDVYNALIEYVNTKFKAIDELLELIIGEEI
jgi:hypothetical protein